MLQTTHIHNPDLPTASRELLDNVNRLIAYGYFAAARKVLERLRAPGAWQSRRYGEIAQSLERTLPLVCWLTGETCPADGDSPKRDTAQLEAWAGDEANRMLGLLTMPVRMQRGMACSDWSEAALEKILPLAAKHDPSVVGPFLISAEAYLKHHLQTVLGPHNPMQDALAAQMAAVGNALGNQAATQLMRQLSVGLTVQVAPTAQAISLAAVARVCFAIAEAGPDNYMLDFALTGVLLLALHKDNPELATRAAHCLATAGTGLMQLANLAVIPPAQRWFASQALAINEGVTSVDVESYLAALDSRIATMPAKKNESEQLSNKSPTLDAFLAKVAGGPLAELGFMECAILDTDERAFAAFVPLGQHENYWHLGRDLINQTGRWPLIVGTFRGKNALCEEFTTGELFSRNLYKQVPEADDVNPRALITAAASVDVTKYLRKQTEEKDDRFEVEDWFETVTYDTNERCVEAPNTGELAAAVQSAQAGQRELHLERWLHDWELSHGWAGDPDLTLEDHTAENQKLVIFLPTTRSWDALAYIHWWGAYNGTEYTIALGHTWQQTYGAELMGTDGCLLECVVDNPPETIEDTFTLAWLHNVIAPCTLHMPAYNLRDYARWLVKSRSWFLYERP